MKKHVRIILAVFTTLLLVGYLALLSDNEKLEVELSKSNALVAGAQSEGDSDD